MVKIEMYKNDEGGLLVIWKCRNNDLIGEVFNNGVEKRGMWDKKAKFLVKNDEARTHQVCKHFGFDSTKQYWRRWA